jgi:hypothetical protein
LIIHNEEEALLTGKQTPFIQRLGKSQVLQTQIPTRYVTLLNLREENRIPCFDFRTTFSKLARASCTVRIRVIPSC